MKRPLVLVGFCYLLTLAVAVRFGAKVSLVLFWCCLLGFAVTFFYWRTRKARVFPAAFLTAAAALLCFCMYSHFAIEPPRVLDGKDLNISGTVCELPYRQYNRWYCVVKVDSVSGSGAPQHFKVRLSSQNLITAEPYSHISGKVHFFLPSGGDGYSSKSYYASKGITMFAYINTYENVKVSQPTSKPPYYYALKLRQALLNSVDSMLPQEEAKIVKGVLLGDKTVLSQQVVSDFRTAGVSHLLAVSGLHMATVAKLIAMLLLFLHVPKRLSALASGAGVLCFMAVTCFVPSVTRSGIMCLLCLAAPLLSRRADPLNSLCTAVLIICLINPYAAADVGLLLSFSAVLGLILCAGRLQNYFNKKWDKIKIISPLVRGVNGILATSLAAMLFTLPIIILNFGRVSVIAPLSNILEIVPSTLMIMFSAVAAVVNMIAPQSFLVMPFAVASGLLAKYMRCCASWLARIPFAGVSASNGFVILWISAAIILFAAALLLSKDSRLLKPAAWLSVIVLLVGILSYQVTTRGVTRVAVLDVGTGESVVITRGGHTAVIGCGGYSSGTLTNYLSSQNAANLDYVQILTQDRDETSNLADLSSRFKSKNLVAQKENNIDGFVLKGASSSANTCWYENSAESDLWGSVKVKTQSAGEAEAVQITAGGISILVCPDGADLSVLPADWLKSDFIVTDAVTEDIRRTSPVCTIISMDKEDLTANARKLTDMNCVQTGGCGNVVLELKGGRTLSLRRET